MPKNVKTIQVVSKKDNISVPLWLAFCMSVALNMGSSPHLANFHICKISGTNGSANPLTHPTEWRLYANQFQTISHVLIWKQLVTIELATTILLKIRIGCSVTWSYLAHHTPLVNAHRPLAATYSLQKAYSVKSWRKRYLGGPKGAPSFQCSRRKMELLGSRREHLLHLNLWWWEMGVCIALFKVNTCLPKLNITHSVTMHSNCSMWITVIALRLRLLGVNVTQNNNARLLHTWRHSI